MAGALAVVPAGILVLIDSFGWRGAFLAIGAIVACTLMPLLLFFYRKLFFNPFNCIGSNGIFFFFWQGNYFQELIG